MDQMTQHEIIVAIIAAVTTVVTGYFTYQVGKKQIRAKTEADAKAAVDARWTQLCDQQQERIDQLHTHIAEISKIEDLLQKQVANSAIDRLDMHEQLQQLEAQAIERERRIRSIEAQVLAKDARIAELEARVTELEAESARKDEIIARLKAELARICEEKRKVE